MLLQVIRALCIAAEVMQNSNSIHRRLHWLGEQRLLLKRQLKALLGFGETILQNDFGINSTGGVIQVIAGVHRNGVLDFLEEVFVVDDGAIGLVISIKPVGAADRLEEAVILHRFIDIQDGACWGIEASRSLSTTINSFI